MPPPAIRVVIVEDQLLLREALVAALEDEHDIDVIDAAADLASGNSLIRGSSPEVVIVDYRLPDGVGTDISSESAARILITGTDEARGVRAALDAGFQGFIAKGRGLQELAQAIRIVHGGGAIFPAELLVAITSDRGSIVGELTPRELEILEDLAQAMQLSEIAERRHLSIHTIRNHVRSILTKLGAHSQLEAVVIAARSGIISL